MTSQFSSHFSPSVIPFGVFDPGDGPRCCTASGDRIIDLAAVERGGALGTNGLFDGPNLNAFLDAGPEAWQSVRQTLMALMADDSVCHGGASHPYDERLLRMPVAIRDYVDFYSSIQHATNLGRMFRPDGDPLLPNWRHLPVGYHGRASTVVVSGTPVVRPSGQRKPPDSPAPIFGPSTRLDFELEIGFITGGANNLGEPISVDDAERHIFGIVLVNDWSARDIQAWEYQPLGPFLGKSFATSISPWVIPLAALEAFKVPAQAQDPKPLPYLLRAAGDWLLDIELEVLLTPAGGEPSVISRTSARNLYWTFSQQLAHATSNGAIASTGDLFASGTISGDQPGSYGSMIELTANGAKPLRLGSGEMRAFLEDGDTLTIRGICGSGDAAMTVGHVSGTIRPPR